MSMVEQRVAEIEAAAASTNVPGAARVVSGVRRGRQPEPVARPLRPFQDPKAGNSSLPFASPVPNARQQGAARQPSPCTWRFMESGGVKRFPAPSQSSGNSPPATPRSGGPKASSSSSSGAYPAAVRRKSGASNWSTTSPSSASKEARFLPFAAPTSSVLQVSPRTAGRGIDRGVTGPATVQRPVRAASPGALRTLSPPQPTVVRTMSARQSSPTVSRCQSPGASLQVPLGPLPTVAFGEVRTVVRASSPQPMLFATSPAQHRSPSPQLRTLSPQPITRISGGSHQSARSARRTGATSYHASLQTYKEVPVGRAQYAAGVQAGLRRPGASTPGPPVASTSQLITSPNHAALSPLSAARTVAATCQAARPRLSMGKAS